MLLYNVPGFICFYLKPLLRIGQSRLHIIFECMSACISSSFVIEFQHVQDIERLDYVISAVDFRLHNKVMHICKNGKHFIVLTMIVALTCNTLTILIYCRLCFVL